MKVLTAFMLGISSAAFVAVAVAQERPGTLLGRRVVLVDAAGTVRVEIAVADDGTVSATGLPASIAPLAPKPEASVVSDSVRRAADCIAGRESPLKLGTAEVQRFLADAKWSEGDLRRLGRALELAAGQKDLARTFGGGAAAISKRMEADLDDCVRLLRGGQGAEAAAAIAKALARPTEPQGPK